MTTNDAGTLTVGITPTTVPCSGNPMPASIQTFTLTVTNPGTTAVACTQLDFTMTYGDTSGALALDPTPIVLGAGTRTPWACWALGQGNWRAVPLPPATGIAAGQTLTFVFANVTINHEQGMNASIQVAPTVTGQTVPALSAGVTKGPAGTGAAPAPTIASFKASPATVPAGGGEVTISWVVTGATAATLLPTGITLPLFVDPGDASRSLGSFQLPVQQETTFSLVATGPGGTTPSPAQATVTVAST
jgi:hypothetical protein